MKTIIELPTNLPLDQIAAIIEESGINVTEIIHDGATNLDKYGAAHGIPVVTMLPDRKKYHTSAQAFNERLMCDRAEALIAVEIKYNRDLIEQARSRGLQVYTLNK